MEGKKIVGNKALKKSSKGKLKKIPVDNDKAEERRAMMKELMAETNLTEEDVLVAEKEFQINYPAGGVTKQEFIQFSSLGFISESLYRAFDKENKGFLDFRKYLLASNVKIESTQDKLDWLFRAFDVDNTGTIRDAEIREIVVYLFKVAAFDEQEDLLVTCIADIKKALGIDGDRDITREEFIKNAAQSSFLKSMMKN